MDPPPWILFSKNKRILILLMLLTCYLCCNGLLVSMLRGGERITLKSMITRELGMRLWLTWPCASRRVVIRGSTLSALRLLASPLWAEWDGTYPRLMVGKYGMTVKAGRLTLRRSHRSPLKRGCQGTSLSNTGRSLCSMRASMTIVVCGCNLSVLLSSLLTVKREP